MQATERTVKAEMNFLFCPMLKLKGQQWRTRRDTGFPFMFHEPTFSFLSATKEKPSKPVKVATSVVKRVMERITARTIRALQDYSETGDVRYLLIVQRHLTAIKNENGDL